MNSASEKKPPSPEDERRERQRSEIVAFLRTRAPKCFLCKWIVENFDLNGTIKGHPVDAMGKEVFPHEGKVQHVRLELQSFDLKAAAAV